MQTITTSSPITSPAGSACSSSAKNERRARRRLCAVAAVGLGRALLPDSRLADRQEAFVLDLKRTYESFLDESQPAADAEKSRKETLKRLQDELKALSSSARPCSACPSKRACPAGTLAGAIELRRSNCATDAIEKGALPPYRQWWTMRAVGGLMDACPNPGQTSGRASLRLLSPDFAEIAAARWTVATVDSKPRVTCCCVPKWHRRVELLSEHCTSPLERPADDGVCRTCSRWPIAADVPVGDRRPRWRQVSGRPGPPAALEETVAGPRGYSALAAKAGRDSCPAAMRQSRFFDGASAGMLKPAWWRLRRLLRRANDFKAHGLTGRGVAGLTPILERSSGSMPPRLR